MFGIRSERAKLVVQALAVAVVVAAVRCLKVVLEIVQKI